MNWLLYALSIGYGLVVAAAEGAEMETWRAAAMGGVLTTTGIGTTAALQQTAETKNRWAQWLVHTAKRCAQRLVLWPTNGNCNAINRLRWCRCTLQPGHKRMHVHARRNYTGATSSLTSWPAQARETPTAEPSSAPMPAEQKCGPLQLSEYGRKIAAWLNVETWANEVAPTLAGKLKEKRPFEVDQFMDDYVHSQLEEPFKEKVAACAYEFGTEHDNVLAVLRVVLRNKLIEIISGRPPKSSEPVGSLDEPSHVQPIDGAQNGRTVAR